MNKLFVYGTLRRGKINHRIYINKPPVSMGVVPNYAFAKGRLTIRPYFGYFVVGEIYEVTENELKNIDRLEGYPGAYDRIIVPVVEISNIDDIFNIMRNEFSNFSFAYAYMIPHVDVFEPAFSYLVYEDAYVRNLLKGANQ